MKTRLKGGVEACLTQVRRIGALSTEQESKSSTITSKKLEKKKQLLGAEYNTVRVARKAVSSERQLNPSPNSIEKVSIASFEKEDDRIMHCIMEHDLKNKVNKTLSFDPRTKKCAVCAPSGHPALVAGEGGPVVLVGADQCFPACLPVVTGEECIRVVRVEDG